MKTKTVYGIEFKTQDVDNYDIYKPTGEDLYEDEADAEAQCLKMNGGIPRPANSWDHDYYTVCDYTLVPRTFKEWP